jgi:hypothetical protein
MTHPSPFAPILLCLALATPAVAQNLLANGGGENDVGGNGFADVPPSSWSRTGGPTVVLYDAFGPAYFGSSDPGMAVRGNNHFAGGNGHASSTMVQMIDVSGQSVQIDAGTVPYTLCGYVGGYSAQDDRAMVTVTFEDGASGDIGSATIGPVFAADRAFITALCPESVSGTVPSGTRTMVVQITFTRMLGTYNDGYADEINLVLDGACPVSGGGCTTTTTSTTSTSSTASTSSTSSTSTSTSSTSTSTTSTTSTSSSTSTSTTSPTSIVTTSTTTSTIVATTTTLAGGCVVAATYDSIACRLDTLLADVGQAKDLGVLMDALLARVTRARDRFTKVPGTTSSRKARNLVKGAIRKLLAFSRRVNGRRGRTVIPAETRARLTTGGADPIRTDMTTFRGTL